jgi:DMSO/TMAO reductase YedYZ molybdopterin-dependent catalytic subunit
MACQEVSLSINQQPFINLLRSDPGPTRMAKIDAFKRLQAGAFKDWQLEIDGLVAHPGSFSISELRSRPSRSQITQVTCEEGWSYIAEWIGVPLSHLLEAVGILPQAKFVVYFSIEKTEWWDSIDMSDALHPQTILAYGFNGGELPVAFGGPLRIRVPRQLGYKSVKYINRLTVTDSLKGFGIGLGSEELIVINTVGRARSGDLVACSGPVDQLASSYGW